ncbi:hypothetical protein P43SY_010224 [Pythium insidiosum]|uniref:Uncharacterized protein n=1 Tax=Pythium insidiosum TaxID=114742 RepID=A0AAD5LRL5_PYTIN|nr:hypothetical protein P43SY_010224 [Pythium insidiosum]
MEEEDERLVNDEAPLPHATRALLDDFQVLVRRYMDDFREVAVGRAYCRTPIFHPYMLYFAYLIAPDGDHLFTLSGVAFAIVGGVHLACLVEMLVLCLGGSRRG